MLFKKGLKNRRSISNLTPEFLEWIEIELRYSRQTIIKYRDCLRRIIEDIGDLKVSKVTLNDMLSLKKKMHRRGLSSARMANMIFAFRKFLRYCREVQNIRTIDPTKINPPKIPKKQVIYLTNKEVKKFVNSIKMSKMYGLRFRTLVEVLLSTGMRISEALSLNRDDIDFEKKEAIIVGKGNKERTVYFNGRALKWIKKYLARRWDEKKPLFVTHCEPKRWSKESAERDFRKHQILSGINKKITPHIIRHTTATNLLFNGADVTFIKEILGHADIQTTCRYYLGLDKKKVKEAHLKYLNFDI